MTGICDLHQDGAQQHWAYVSHDSTRFLHFVCICWNNSQCHVKCKNLFSRHLSNTRAHEATWYRESFSSSLSISSVLNTGFALICLLSYLFIYLISFCTLLKRENGNYHATRIRFASSTKKYCLRWSRPLDREIIRRTAAATLYNLTARHSGVQWRDRLKLPPFMWTTNSRQEHAETRTEPRCVATGKLFGGGQKGATSEMRSGSSSSSSSIRCGTKEM